MAAAHRGDLRGRAGHLAGHPADRRDQLGDGVLGGDRIGHDGGVHHPPPPAGKDPGLLDHLLDRVVDPMRPLGPGQPLPPVGQGGGMNPLSSRAIPVATFQRRSQRAASAHSASDRSYKACKVNTAAATGAGSDGRPRPEGNKSANS
jgi:hypothetical protein